MPSETLKTITVKFWKIEAGPDDIKNRELDTHNKYSNLDKDMFLFGEFLIDDQFGGTFGKKVEAWSINKNKPIDIDDIEYNIYKIFDENNKWAGTIQELLIDEICQSYKSDPKIIFSVDLKGGKNIFNLIQRPDFFIFPFILNPKSKDVEYFILKKKSISIGTDWDLKRCILGDVKVAEIDSKRGGKKVKISIYNEDLAKNDLFLKYIILFTITIPYQEEIKSRIKLYSNSIKEGTLILHISDSVLKLSAQKVIPDSSQPATSKKVSKKVKKKTIEKETTPKRISKEELKESIKKDLSKKERAQLSNVQEQLGLEQEESSIKQPQKETNSASTELSFKIEDPIEKAPGIGKKTGARFRELGINTIGDFINANIDELHEKLPVTWITKSKLKKWQNICIEHII